VMENDCRAACLFTTPLVECLDGVLTNVSASRSLSARTQEQISPVGLFGLLTPRHPLRAFILDST
jgi:hypothetical protein